LRDGRANLRHLHEGPRRLHQGMERIAPILNGLAALAWPVVVAIALLVFKSQISAVMGRLNQAKRSAMTIDAKELPQLDETPPPAEEVGELDATTILQDEIYIVHHPGVEVFADAACTRSFGTGVRGVILVATSPGGLKSYPIVPSTRTRFEKGKRVAWDWGMGSVWAEAWYRDPDTDEIKTAWASSAAFIGFHLDDQ
jgi:hypothetical protein